MIGGGGGGGGGGGRSKHKLMYPIRGEREEMLAKVSTGEGGGREGVLKINDAKALP